MVIIFSMVPDGSPTTSGVYVSTEWLEFGLTLSTSGGYSGFPRLLNTSDVKSDLSLGSPNAKCSPPGPGDGKGGEPGMLGENCDSLGNVLIVQGEDTELSAPSSNGGAIACDFSPQVFLVSSITLMGIQGNSTAITISHGSGARSTTISVVGLGKNSVQTVAIRMKHVSRLTVNLSGSGAVVSIAIGREPDEEPLTSVSTPVPSPFPGGSAPLPDDLVLVQIDFDSLPNGSPTEGGSYVSAEWLDEVGFTLSASGGYSSSPLILNTSNIGSDNESLGSPNEKCSLPGPGSGAGGEPDMPGANCDPLGNVLIIQTNDIEENAANSKGGVITFDFFPIAPLVHSIGLLGITGNNTTITVVHEDGTRTTEITVIGLGRNSVQSISIDLKRVSQLNVRLSGIAGVTDISIGKDPNEVVRQPEPMPNLSQVPPTAETPVVSESPSFSSSQSPSQEPPSGHNSAPIPPADNCQDVIIDFDTLPDGSPLPGGWWCDKDWLGPYGLVLSASGGFLDIPRLLSTSDVANVDYATLQQGSPNEKCDPSGPGVGEGGEPGMKGQNCVPQGNVLTIMDMPEVGNDSISPDGVITFDFLQSMYLVRSIGLMNIHGNDTKVNVVYDSGVGMETTDIHIMGQGVNSVQTVPINLKAVSQLHVHLLGRSVVTFISFCFRPQASPSGITDFPATSPAPSMLPSRSPSRSASPTNTPP